MVEQSNGLSTQSAEGSPFAQPFSKFPKSLADADRQRLRTQCLAVIRDSVLPAYVQFGRFVRGDCAPNGRTEVGMWALPDGGARQALALRESTILQGVLRMDWEGLKVYGDGEIR